MAKAKKNDKELSYAELVARIKTFLLNLLVQKKQLTFVNRINMFLLYLRMLQKLRLRKQYVSFST